MKNALVKVENDINSLMGKIENPLKETLGFIKKHKKLIDKITPHNPSIPIDDEWNDPEYDEFYERKIKENH